MKIETWYQHNFESQIQGRYITLKQIKPLLKKYQDIFSISSAGTSELGNDIPKITLGKGSNKILVWSQMHGNETTCTKAIFDFLKFITNNELFKDEISHFLENNTLVIIPILNPDGAIAYTRENANGVDLNRDAIDLSQEESIVLRKVFNEFKPHLCLNLHDQRTIYGLDNGLPATISFLSPAADKNRSVSNSRIESMKQIVKMNKTLQQYIPGQVGRYDDTFNENCVGDSFQKNEVPTILFEAGHYKTDYKRETTRKFIFYSFLSLFDMLPNEKVAIDYEDYFLIPKNKTNYRDLILRDVKLDQSSNLSTVVMQYEERLIDGAIDFSPVVEADDNIDDIYGHYEPDPDTSQFLLNSQKKK